MATDLIPAALIRELRQRIVDVIADYKSYDVPSICKRVGLADGDSQEAFSSKARYVKARLEPLPAHSVVQVGELLAREHDDYRLAEVVRKIEELVNPQITTLTRRRLMSIFDNRSLVSEISDIEFIRTVWPIACMPAPRDSQENTLEDYLIRHTVRNDDMSTREVLEELGVLTCSQSQLVKFLEAVVHPEVVSVDVQQRTVEAINLHISGDGYCMVRTRTISGSPVYSVQQAAIGSPADVSISEALAAFNPEHVHPRWLAALDRRSSDPEGAITLARTLMEDVCKWLLVETGGTWEETDDLPLLYRKLAKSLNLAPDSHTEQTFKQILGSCQSIIEGLGALRNKLGDAHSVGPKRVRPSARHAELAVNLAGTMATFLVSTWKARQEAVSKK